MWVNLFYTILNPKNLPANKMGNQNKITCFSTWNQSMFQLKFHNLPDSDFWESRDIFSSFPIFALCYIKSNIIFMVNTPDQWVYKNSLSSCVMSNNILFI